MKTNYNNGYKNKQMQLAIIDHRKSGGYFFEPGTMSFWGSSTVCGMFENNTFVTSEKNYSGDKILYTARLYNWDDHNIETIGEFQQFDNASDAITFAKSYEEAKQ